VRVICVPKVQVDIYVESNSVVPKTSGRNTRHTQPPASLTPTECFTREVFRRGADNTVDAKLARVLFDIRRLVQNSLIIYSQVVNPITIQSLPCIRPECYEFHKIILAIFHKFDILTRYY